MKRTHEVVFRREIKPIPTEASQAQLKTLPLADQRVIKEMQTTLNNTIKGIGNTSALEILWAVGRLLNKEGVTMGE